MTVFLSLLTIFAVTAVATLSAAWSARWLGKQPNFACAMAITVGVTAACAINLTRPLNDVVFGAVLVACVGFSVYAGQRLSRHHRV